MNDTITVLRHSHARFAKTWNADGTVTPYGDGKFFSLRETPVDGFAGLSALLTELQGDPFSCVIRGKWIGADAARERDPEFKPGFVRRALAQFDEVPRRWLLVDVDKFEPLSCDPVLMPELAIDEYITTSLPPEFWGRSCHWQLSNSAGRPENAGVLKAHLWFWLRDPLDGEQLKAWAQAGGYPVDAALFRTVQAHYTALPVMGEGVSDPVARRSGVLDGLASDDVPLVVDEAVLAQAEAAGRPSAAPRHQVMREIVSTDPVAQRLVELGLVLSQARGGELNVRCPFTHLHTGPSAETGTQYFPPNTRGYVKGNFKCMHAHCQDRPRAVWLAELGIFEGLDGVAEAFDVVGEAEGAAGAVGAGEGTGGEVGEAGSEAGSGSVVELKGIPEAKHVTTDQANAGRIVRRHGKQVFVAAGRWYSWDTRRWVPDESNVYRWACELSRMVHAEANALRAKAGLDLSANAKLDEVAKALDKWAVKCEMKATIEAAVGLARKMLTVDGGLLDRDPWLLNCRNGTVDLRTGELRPHRAGDYITRLVDIDYDASARAPLWNEVLGRITLEEGRGPGATRPVATFLQRWFGYCATGMTREQQFVVHYGNGSNGKSTVLDTVADVLGDYAGTAAPGLLMNGKDRHPTEIADLFGRRMVTAHETGEGGVLREDFVKQATGGDRIKARFMHADFFEFAPTHKLQLLTNHKPIIKGQDNGIWRRVLLVPYLARFASVEEVRAGRAHYIKDTSILDKLLAERAGILAWVVQGAVAWVADGLQPPDSVLAASKDYQTEQDRIGQFITECCELGITYAESLSAGMGGGLYPAYVGWSKESGTLPLSKNRFLNEIQRAVPGCEVAEKKVQVDGGRRLVRHVHGIRLLQSD